MNKRYRLSEIEEAVSEMEELAAYVNAKKEADSACLFIGYQPKMP